MANGARWQAGVARKVRAESSAWRRHLLQAWGSVPGRWDASLSCSVLPRAVCFGELNPRALGNAGCFSAAPRPERVAQTVSAFAVYTQHRFRLPPEPVAAPAWFQLARQEQAVQGLPWAPVVLLGRFRIVSSIVGASTHMPQLHVHLPGEDGLRHVLSPAATARVVTGGRGDWRLAWEMDGGIAFPQLVISPRSGRA